MKVTTPKLPIQKYVEWLSRGRRTQRITYVLKEWDLPVPLPGAEWVQDTKFNPVEAIRLDPALKEVLRLAIKNGSAIAIERE